MNALELAQLLRQECGIAGAGTPTAFTGQTGEAKRVVDWVTQADLFVQSLEVNWKFLWKEFQQSTIVGDPDISKPNDFDEWDPDSFYLDYTADDWVKLKVFTDYREWRTKWRQGTKTNEQPTRLVIRPDDDLILDWPPDKVYSLTGDYYRKPVALAVDADEPPYPSRYHRIIIAKGKEYYGIHEDAPEYVQEGIKEWNDIWPRLQASQVIGQQARYNDEYADNLVVEVE